MASDPHGLTPFQRLFETLRVERNDIWIAIIYSVAIGVLTLCVPVATQALVNSIAFGNLLQPVVVLTLVVLAGLGISVVFQAMLLYVVEVMQQRIFVRVASNVVNRLLRVQPEAFQKRHGPELVNRFLEVVTVQKAASLFLLEGLGLAMQTLVGMVLLAVYHPWLLAFDLVMIVAMAFVIFPMGRGAIATSIAESRTKYDLVAWMEELASHSLTFRPPESRSFAVKQADRLAKEYLHHRRRHFRILLRQMVGSLSLYAIGSAGLLGIGGWLVIDRQLTLGQLVAAELVLTVVLSSFSKMGKHLETFYDLMASLDKLGHIEDLPMEGTGFIRLPSRYQGMAVSVESVTYGQPGFSRLLDGLTWKIEPGERIGLIPDRSRHGVAALLDILLRLREPAGGFVEVDGVDLREIWLSDLRAQALLLRDQDIFAGTIEDNVRYGRNDCSPLDVREALDRVGLLKEIADLPGGVRTQLLPNGYPLSPEQSARLILARALVSRARLLIVDELLDRVDDRSQRELIVKQLLAPNQPRTVIIVSTSPAVLSLCDRVYRLENGRLHELPIAVLLNGQTPR
jgi:putative ABC transport system ATP-binding protein